ncbi:uncharacterized protein L201_006919 [Kwoniella dendrophila CBS 6074]|uniref:G-protein coupled receptors family 1 profile domain-containing protein n=1 Tax=Kwoniella dendrophila CBS 6074 TaxID=1295534 RepID=A0AAX4K2H1_9TREE
MTDSITQEDVRYWNAIGSVAAGISMLLALFILFSFLWIYKHKSARHTLDRISFRILLWSMIWEVAYSIDYLIVCANPSFVVTYSKTKACVVGAYFMISIVGVVNWLCTCIAINLMITICFNRNPIQMGLEKWYIVGSTALGLGIPIIPTILGHLGYDPIYGSCYFTSNSENRLKYLLSDMYLWQILSSLIASIAVVATLIRLVRHGRKTTKLLLGGNSMNRILHQRDIEAAQSPVSSDNDKNHNNFGSSSFNADSLPSCFTSLKQNTTSAFNNNLPSTKMFKREPKSESMTNQLQDKLFKISIKIALYPIALILVNGIMTSGDLYLTTTGGVNSESDFIFFLIYNFMYAGRGIPFACLGIFIDPCLKRGYKAVLKERREMRAHGTESELRVKSPTIGDDGILPIIEISEILPYQQGPTEKQDYSKTSKQSESMVKFDDEVDDNLRLNRCSAVVSSGQKRNSDNSLMISSSGISDNGLLQISYGSSFRSKNDDSFKAGQSSTDQEEANGPSHPIIDQNPGQPPKTALLKGSSKSDKRKGSNISDSSLISSILRRKSDCDHVSNSDNDQSASIASGINQDLIINNNDNPDDNGKNHNDDKLCNGPNDSIDVNLGNQKSKLKNYDDHHQLITHDKKPQETRRRSSGKIENQDKDKDKDIEQIEKIFQETQTRL